ncbi:hypothetical protein TRIUR3_09427 [Triticum urartu]|uniref:Prefoldin subunit 1 n=2 Tax=Triticum urartu TaxID=4572 RepID=M8A8H5_TRIUA|nr:hypothetical protein TRIUR3_09427 [Triticum urartu]
MAAAAKEVDMKKMELMKEARPGHLVRCPEAEPDLQLRHRRDMAAAAKELDMKKMELMKEVRAHQVAIGELNNLPPSRAAYQKTCNIFFRKDIKSAVASQQKQLDIAKGKLQKLDQA